MINVDGKIYRNIQEQVEKNKDDIEALQEALKGNVFKTEADYESDESLTDIDLSSAKVGDIIQYLSNDTIGVITGITQEADMIVTIIQRNIWIRYRTATGQYVVKGNIANLSNYVDLTSYQTITGVKTFASGLKIGSQMSIESNSNASILDIKRNGATEYRFSTTSFIPNTNNYYNLGDSTYKWKDLYLSGKLTNGTNEIYFDNNNSLHVGVVSGYPTIFESALVPYRNNTYDLGIASLTWKNLYLSGNISDGTNSIAVADITSLYKHAITTEEISIEVITNNSTPLTNISQLEDLISNSIKAVYLYNNHKFQITDYLGGYIYYTDGTSISDTNAGYSIVADTVTHY